MHLSVPPRPHVVHAARVAAVAALLFAAVFVLAAGVLDTLVARRVLWEVDQRVGERLADVSHVPVLPGVPEAPDDLGTDGAPVFVWLVAPGGSVRPLSTGAPAFPGTPGPPRTATVGGTRYRTAAVPYRGGWLVAAQDLAGPSHIGQVLLEGELAIGPVLVVAVFIGSLVIGLQAVRPVEEARRRLLEFTADASHELRTPLTVIEAEIELARGGPPNADREALRHVSRESRRLQRIVEDLLWLARFDAEPPPPDRESVDLAPVVAHCADRFGAVAAGRRQDLVVRCGDTQPAWVHAAPEWLDRLAGTLIDNACRYAPEGGQVRVTVGGRGNRSVLCVEDSGPGIPPAERDRLFDRFRRVTEHPEGAGLGLAIADSVVRTTGGRWRLADSPLGGAMFEVSWRRSAAPGTAPSVDP